jgi:hypothetical protein
VIHRRGALGDAIEAWLAEDDASADADVDAVDDGDDAGE